MQFSLLRLFAVVTASAILAAICRVTGPQLFLAPFAAAGAFACAVAYREIKQRRSGGSLGRYLALTTLMIASLIVGMLLVCVFLLLITGLHVSLQELPFLPMRGTKGLAISLTTHKNPLITPSGNVLFGRGA